VRANNPGGATGAVTAVTGTAPVTSSDGTTPAIGVSAIGYWQVPTGTNSFINLGSVANTTPVVGVLVQWPISVGHITINVTAQDNSANLYDFGFYNAAGTLVANVGAASYTTTGIKRLAFSQGTVRFNPGLYFIGWTGNANVLNVTGLAANQTVWHFGASANAGASVGGAMPATITPPATAPVDTSTYLWAALDP
jgi:hypothetical protein